MSLAHLSSACRIALENHSDFWLLAAITDQSFEEGARSSAFRKSVDVYQSVGLAQVMLRRLERGINGLLAECIEALPGVSIVRQNPSGAPDVHFRVGDQDTWVECKHIYDCTFDKQFRRTVPADGKKLLSLKADKRLLAQVVFFVQLPSYSYPCGKWYGSKSCKSRADYLVTKGIAAQYSRLQPFMRHAPCWPENPPHIHRCVLSEPTTRDAMNEWFVRAFQPSTEWKFDPATQLRDAAVGAAIWAY